MADDGDNNYGIDAHPGDTDGIDLRALFDSTGYAGTNPRADGFLTVTTGAVPTDTLVWVDANGGADSFTPVLTLHGVTPSTLIDSFFLFQ